MQLPASKRIGAIASPNGNISENNRAFFILFAAWPGGFLRIRNPLVLLPGRATLRRNRYMKLASYPLKPVLILCLATFMGSVGCAATKPAKPPAKAVGALTAAEAPATHAVVKGSLKPKAQLDAVLVSQEMQPLKLEPKAWADLTVLEAVSHGARVKKDDVLVRLDTDKIKDQLDDLEKDRPIATLAYEQAAAELNNLESTTPLRLETARRTARTVGEDLAYFEKIGREQREKSAAFNLKSAEERLAYALEELKQLEKMYAKDDLVEATEEIILRRQKFTVESAQFSLAASKLGTERDLKVLLPREAEALKSGKRDQDYALSLAEETLPKALSKKRLDVEKLRRDQAKSDKRLADLRKDLQLLTVKAPMDGMVYYGACENGRWLTAAVVAKKLVPTAKLTPTEVFMTIVNPDKVLLKAMIAEADLAKFKSGMTGQAAPVAAPDKKLAVKLEEISEVPSITGGFEATLSLQEPKPARLVPGMNVKVTLGENVRPDLPLAPCEAVFSEGGEKFVWLAKPDGKPEKRAVKTGDTDNKQVEIVEGLEAGEKILLKAPAK